MSRYYDDYDGDESFPNASAFWRTNADRAMKGKRGRKALAELREALLALPEKRLIARALCTVNPDARKDPEPDLHDWRNREIDEIVAEQGQGACAVGVYAWWQKVKAGADPTEAFEQLPTLEDTNHDIWETEEVGKQAGLTRYVAWELAYRNDETFGHLTPEARYEATLAWIDEQLASTS